MNFGAQLHEVGFLFPICALDAVDALQSRTSRFHTTTGLKDTHTSRQDALTTKL